MTADHVGARPGRQDGFGFGLGFEVHTRLGDSAIEGSMGEHGWSGAAGTTFWVDPKEELVAIYMVQASEGEHAVPAHPVPDHGAGRDHRLEGRPEEEDA
jgi:CubicO group peptidase (beta-lactamase class C family)